MFLEIKKIIMKIFPLQKSPKLRKEPKTYFLISSIFSLCGDLGDLSRMLWQKCMTKVVLFWHIFIKLTGIEKYLTQPCMKTCCREHVVRWMFVEFLAFSSKEQILQMILGFSDGSFRRSKVTWYQENFKGTPAMIENYWLE